MSPKMRTAPKPLSVEEWRSMAPISSAAGAGLKTGRYIFSGSISRVGKEQIPFSESVCLNLQITAGFGTRHCRLLLRVGNEEKEEQGKHQHAQDITDFFSKGKDLEGIVGVNFRYVGGVPNSNVNYLRIPSYFEAVVSNGKVVFYQPTM